MTTSSDSANIRKVSSVRHTSFAIKPFLFLLLPGLLACQPEKSAEIPKISPDTTSASVNKASDQQIDALKQSYEKKIDSILHVQRSSDAELQSKVASLMQEAETLAAYNQNLDLQVGRQASDIQRLQDSLQAVLDQKNETFEIPFNAVALTEESLDSLVDSTEPALASASFGTLDANFQDQTFAPDLDSLYREIDQRESQVAWQDKRLDGILSNLAIAVEPKHQKAARGYEDVIINTLLSTVSDDTLIVNQYNRGFYTKQDLNAMVGDYKVRKTDEATAGKLVLYRRKKKQDQQPAVIYLNGKSYQFPRNKIDTILVSNVFDVQVCDANNRCESMAFSSQMTNYAEVSRLKGTKANEIKAVNQVLGEFYARQVASARSEN